MWLLQEFGEIFFVVVAIFYVDRAQAVQFLNPAGCSLEVAVPARKADPGLCWWGPFELGSIVGRGC